MKLLLKLLANKYVIATAVFIAMMLFFSPYSYFTMRSARQELEEINSKIAFMNQAADSMQNELDALNKDAAVVERYARELYFQKRDNEDVFVIK